MRLALTIAYDGAPHSGWQSQPQPHANTVQDRIEEAIEAIAKTHVRIHGSGRTDTGVHATGQIAHFDVPDTVDMNPYNWVPAINSKLPASVRIMDAREVAGDFHARHSAVGKTYTYRLSLSPVLPPFLAGRAWHIPRQLNPVALQEALDLMLGTHNFRHFCALRGNEYEGTEYERTITKACAEPLDDGHLITISGGGFLYKMVRFLSSAAVQAAGGRMRLDDLEYLLTGPADPEKRLIPACAPPDGLVLKEVHY